MSNRGRGKSSRSVSSVAMLARQRKAIGEYESKRKKKAAAARNQPPLSSVPKRRHRKRRNYADVKREAARKKLVEDAQANTPYPSRLQYGIATHAFAPSAVRKRQKDPDERATWLAEWGVYKSTSHMDAGHDGPVAFLHSFQQDQAKQTVMGQHGIQQDEQRGNIYEPNIYGNQQGHDMRSNSAWLLGLAHNRRKVVMTAPLDDQNLVRQSAQYGPASRRNTEFNLSALGREVFGMLQRKHFQVGGNDSFGNQTLVPTSSARRARLVDFKTPRGIRKPRLKQFFQRKGLDVGGIS